MLSEQCQFVKQNTERCKRPIAVGQAFCWQHARGLQAKWRSLTRNQTLGFSIIGVLSLAATIIFGILSLLPKTPAAHSIQVQSFGDNSPNVVDNQGSVLIQSSSEEKKPPKPPGGKKQ